MHRVALESRARRGDAMRTSNVCGGPPAAGAASRVKMYVSLARNSYMNVVRRARKLKGGAGTMGRLIAATYF